MFIAVPLGEKPSWRSPPWMTLLLILINCWVFFAWQMPEERAIDKLATEYARTPLPPIEAPAFAREVQAQAQQSGKRRQLQRAEMVDRMVQGEHWAALYEQMWHDPGFRQRLLDNRVIRPGSADYTRWRAARDVFTPREPKPFTPRWAQNHNADAPFEPITLLTNAFLHGSEGHLFGNMVFLFMFGFTLEKALGPLLYLVCYLLGGVGASALAAWTYQGMGGLGLGASGAISALMGMYVVLYGMRRIPFFYMVLFYFNLARGPALVLLPVWIAWEGVQHLMGGGHVAYMAHLGGLVTGAVMMAGLKLTRRFDAPAEVQATVDDKALAQDDERAALTARARAAANALRFGEAAQWWQQVARLSPRDTEVLEAWFQCARHEPASDAFHAAARQILKLPARDDPTRQLQHRCFRLYFDTAKPSVRISPATMQSLVRAFTAIGEWRDAQSLARALAATQPAPSDWVDTVELLATGLARAGRMDDARAWLPELQRQAPQREVTRWLEKSAGG